MIAITSLLMCQWVLVEVLDAAGVEGTGAAQDSVHLVAFLDEKLGQVGAILKSESFCKQFLMAKSSFLVAE